jgi:chaperonin GroES
MTTTFKPLSNYVLVRPMEMPDTTPSGLLLPEASKEKPNHGTVVAYGDGVRNDRGGLIPMALKEGDTVLFQKYSGIEVKLDGVKYLLMRETDILGILSAD